MIESTSLGGASLWLLKIVLKWPIPGFFPFIFVLFKQFENIKKLSSTYSGIRTRVVIFEGKHADHLTIKACLCQVCGTVLHLSEQLLLTPEDPGSIQAISKF